MHGGAGAGGGLGGLGGSGGDGGGEGGGAGGGGVGGGGGGGGGGLGGGGGGGLGGGGGGELRLDHLGVLCGHGEDRARRTVERDLPVLHPAADGGAARGGVAEARLLEDKGRALVVYIVRDDHSGHLLARQPVHALLLGPLVGEGRQARVGEPRLHAQLLRLARVAAPVVPRGPLDEALLQHAQPLPQPDRDHVCEDHPEPKLVARRRERLRVLLTHGSRVEPHARKRRGRVHGVGVQDHVNYHPDRHQGVCHPVHPVGHAHLRVPILWRLGDDENAVRARWQAGGGRAVGRSGR